MKPKSPRRASSPALPTDPALADPVPVAPTLQYDDAHESYDEPATLAAFALAEDEDEDQDETEDGAPALPPGTVHPDAVPRVRLDVWLWAARLFKTRAQAKAAIESGRVRVNGERAKVAKLVEPGLRVFAPQGWETVEVLVRQCADNRRGAPEARLLYEETPASIAERARRAELRRTQPGFDARPARDDRRRRAGFKREGYQGGLDAGPDPQR